MKGDCISLPRVANIFFFCQFRMISHFAHCLCAVQVFRRFCLHINCSRRNACYSCSFGRSLQMSQMWERKVWVFFLSPALLVGARLLDRIFLFFYIVLVMRRVTEMAAVNICFAIAHEISLYLFRFWCCGPSLLYRCLICFSFLVNVAAQLGLGIVPETMYTITTCSMTLRLVHLVLYFFFLLTVSR